MVIPVVWHQIDTNPNLVFLPIQPRHQIGTKSISADFIWCRQYQAPNLPQFGFDLVPGTDLRSGLSAARKGTISCRWRKMAVCRLCDPKATRVMTARPPEFT